MIYFTICLFLLFNLKSTGYVSDNDPLSFVTSEVQWRFVSSFWGLSLEDDEGTTTFGHSHLSSVPSFPKILFLMSHVCWICFVSFLRRIFPFHVIISGFKTCVHSWTIKCCDECIILRSDLHLRNHFVTKVSCYSVIFPSYFILPF